VQLTGISPGSATENQQVTITGSSGNPSLIPQPTINYESPASTGSLLFTPTPYASGTAVLTVMVNDGQATNNTVTRVFIVKVEAVNQAPTLNLLADISLGNNAPMQVIGLSGISSGAPNENQVLTVSATSSNPALIPNPAVSYTSPATTGSLSFTPVADASGTAVITVTVSDGQASDQHDRAHVHGNRQFRQPAADARRARGPEYFRKRRDTDGESDGNWSRRHR